MYELVMIRDVEDLKKEGIIDSTGKNFMPGKEPPPRIVSAEGQK
jgi:hypothetical protein